MKKAKIFILVIALLMTLTAAACDNTTTPASTEPPPSSSPSQTPAAPVQQSTPDDSGNDSASLWDGEYFYNNNKIIISDYGYTILSIDPGGDIMELSEIDDYYHITDDEIFRSKEYPAQNTAVTVRLARIDHNSFNFERNVIPLGGGDRIIETGIYARGGGSTTAPAGSTALSHGSASISLDKSTYQGGDTIRVTVTGITQQMVDDMAYVAVFAVGAGHNDNLSFDHVNAGDSNFSVFAPPSAGNYEMRLYSMSGVFTDDVLIAKIPFTATAAPAPATPPPVATTPPPAATTPPPATTTPQPFDLSGAMNLLSHSNYSGISIVNNRYTESFLVPHVPSGSYLIPTGGAIGRHFEQPAYSNETIRLLSEDIPNSYRGNFMRPNQNGFFTNNIGAVDQLAANIDSGDTSYRLYFVVDPDNVVLGHIITEGRIP
jgi:hypothetical protein